MGRTRAQKADILIPWKQIASAVVPETGAPIRLYRHGDAFSIRLELHELMNSRVHGSEDALAEFACARIEGMPAPRVLIGGLGMGYTLAAALSRLPDKADITVAELVPAVVEWNQGPIGHLAGHPLRDSRVVVHEGDVADILRSERKAWDAILLDVDNGPSGLTRKANDWLYTRDGLATTHEALRPRGVLAVWSAGPDPTFSDRLRDADFAVNETRVRAHEGRKSGWHTLWIATV